MLYTHLGRIVAALGLLFGILLIYLSVMGLFVNPPVEPNVQLERILSRQLETGILFVLFAITVGILTEISRSVRADVIDAKSP